MNLVVGDATDDRRELVFADQSTSTEAAKTSRLGNGSWCHDNGNIDRRPVGLNHLNQFWSNRIIVGRTTHDNGGYRKPYASVSVCCSIASQAAFSS